METFGHRVTFGQETIGEHVRNPPYGSSAQVWETLWALSYQLLASGFTPTGVGNTNLALDKRLHQEMSGHPTDLIFSSCL